VVAEVSSVEEPYLMGGPGLVSIDQTGCSLVEAVNAGLEPIQLHHGEQIGIADNVDGEDLVHYNADMVNAIVKRQFKNRAKMEPGSTTSEFQKLCKLEVPAEYEVSYQKLLLKHRKVFSLDKSDLGYCSTVLHQLFMRKEEFVYVK
jgi:hypothetical protein